jgi:eukaryotic-like serine/threonine-protein kinase
VIDRPRLSDRVVAHLSRIASGRVEPGQRYQLLDEIGRGGMGVVYRAVDLELQREVAVKILQPAASPDLETRLMREARIIGQLEHPGIVPIHDVGRTEDGRLFHVMRLIEGRPLQAQVTAGIDAPECFRIVDRLCDTLAFAHSHGIVHRDVKPENVMLGPFGEVLLLDWGVAREDESDVARVVGTHGFMPPEQAEGQSATADARADIYGMGALLDACMPRPRAKALDAVIGRCRAERPADRYQTIEDLAVDLRRLAAGHAVSAYRESAFEIIRRVASRYRVALGLVAAYLLFRALLLLAAGV